MEANSGVNLPDLYRGASRINQAAGELQGYLQGAKDSGRADERALESVCENVLEPVLEASARMFMMRKVEVQGVGSRYEENFYRYIEGEERRRDEGLMRDRRKRSFYMPEEIFERSIYALEKAFGKNNPFEEMRDLMEENKVLEGVYRDLEGIEGLKSLKDLKEIVKNTSKEFYNRTKSNGSYYHPPSDLEGGFEGVEESDRASYMDVHKLEHVVGRALSFVWGYSIRASQEEGEAVEREIERIDERMEEWNDAAHSLWNLRGLSTSERYHRRVMEEQRVKDNRYMASGGSLGNLEPVDLDRSLYIPAIPIKNAYISARLAKFDPDNGGEGISSDLRNLFYRNEEGADMGLEDSLESLRHIRELDNFVESIERALRLTEKNIEDDRGRWEECRVSDVVDIFKEVIEPPKKGNFGRE